MLSPLIFYNVVMGIIGSFQVFTQVYVMTGVTLARPEQCDAVLRAEPLSPGV